MLELDPDWLTIANDHRWLVGVSGGRDSVALLHACVRAGVRDLIVCHVNHGLRGDESDGDELFVRDLAEKLSLPFYSFQANVAEISETEKKSIELAAREARHHFFRKASEGQQCHGILLAHHADDQAETTLFNLLRGSSGLKGMQKVQHLEQAEISLYRPLLETTRDEINVYISEHGIEYREDSSNAKDFATRNRMRNEVMPLLKEIMGREVAPAINRALQAHQQMDSLVQEMVDYESLIDPQGRLYLPSLESLAKALQRIVIHRYLSEQGISNISKELVESAVKMLDKDQPAKLNLPKGKFLRRRQQRVYVEA